jgi:hypothetical protein
VRSIGAGDYEKSIPVGAVFTVEPGSTDQRRPLDELAQELIARCGDRELPLRHYTRERLFSVDARLRWVAPDLEPPPGRR